MNKLFLLSRLGILATLLVLSFTSCNDVIFDEEGDCSINYRIRFKYDKNMKFANAFPNEVTSVSLYVFDELGTLVYKDFENGDVLKSDSYSMLVELPSGDYDVLAWCGVGNGESFTIPEATIGVTKKEELTCRMNRVSANGVGWVDKDLAPLYHGYSKISIPDVAGTYFETISLTKNTNVVRVVLQQLSGEDVNPDQFSFEIQDYNGFMAYDNSLIADELMIYKPWSVEAGNADMNAEIYKSNTRASSVGVAIAEMTTGRLMANARPILVVRNLETNEVVLSVPIVDYALLVKGNYNRAMEDQEYLDRQDEYNMTFFLDESGNWISSSIIVNSWRVVLNNQVIK